MNENNEKHIVEQLAEMTGGTINEIAHLGDGSGFATMSFPLPKDHWIYGERSCENFVCEHEGKEITHEYPPMVFRMGTADDILVAIRRDGGEGPPPIMTRDEMAQKIRSAGKYAIRASTMKGKEMDFDPDAMLQNLVVGFLGYWTKDGLSSDEWSNPPKEAL